MGCPNSGFFEDRKMYTSRPHVDPISNCTCRPHLSLISTPSFGGKPRVFSHSRNNGRPAGRSVTGCRACPTWHRGTMCTSRVEYKSTPSLDVYRSTPSFAACRPILTPSFGAKPMRGSDSSLGGWILFPKCVGRCVHVDL